MAVALRLLIAGGDGIFRVCTGLEIRARGRRFGLLFLLPTPASESKAATLE